MSGDETAIKSFEEINYNNKPELLSSDDTSTPGNLYDEIIKRLHDIAGVAGTVPSAEGTVVEGTVVEGTVVEGTGAAGTGAAGTGAAGTGAAGTGAAVPDAEDIEDDDIGPSVLGDNQDILDTKKRSPFLKNMLYKLNPSCILFTDETGFPYFKTENPSGDQPKMLAICCKKPPQDPETASNYKGISNDRPVNATIYNKIIDELIPKNFEGWTHIDSSSTSDSNSGLLLLYALSSTPESNSGIVPSLVGVALYDTNTMTETAIITRMYYKPSNCRKLLLLLELFLINEKYNNPPIKQLEIPDGIENILDYKYTQQNGIYTKSLTFPENLIALISLDPTKLSPISDTTDELSA